MSIGDEIAYRRSARGKDATGSLVFDVERKRALKQGAEPGKKSDAKAKKQKKH